MRLLMHWIMTVDVKIRLPQVGAKMSLLGDDRKKTDENIHAQKRTLMNRPSPIGPREETFPYPRPLSLRNGP